MHSAADRLLMTRLAIAGDDAFELTLIEMERSGPSYTIDSVVELRRLYGDEAELFLLMAADSLAQIDAWRQPDELLERIEWVVGPRPGVALPDRSALEERFGERASRIHLLGGPSLDVSSTADPRASGGRARHPLPCAARRRGADRRSRALPPRTKEWPVLTDPDRVEIPSDAAELAHRIVEIASDKKGNDIVLLRTAELTTMADFFVIASGRSDRQVQALAGAIIDELRREGIRPLGAEGQAVALGAAGLRER